MIESHVSCVLAHVQTGDVSPDGSLCKIWFLSHRQEKRRGWGSVLSVWKVNVVLTEKVLQAPPTLFTPPVRSQNTYISERRTA